MRIGILTSSRADYGIYRPLLKALQADPFFEYTIVAFGTHLSSYYGRTIDQITADGFEVKHTISTMMLDDSPEAVASAAAVTALKFADFWRDHRGDFDLVFCLGDRYEMFGAVMAGVPFEIPFAHLHGGETTEGAIDNVYRHAITHASMLHFTSAQVHADRVNALIATSQHVVVSGALSLDNVRSLALLSKEDFRKKWNIDLDLKSILLTIHPETVGAALNRTYIDETARALKALANSYQIIVTLPNADTYGSAWRELFVRFSNENSQFKVIENFGTQSYFTAMKYSSFLLGNTSSGIIEAASFGKFAVNVGDRQKGRFAGENVLHVPFSADKILAAVREVERAPVFIGANPYDLGGAADIILETLKSRTFIKQ